MELTCPIQCTYRLTEVTVRKDLAQQSTQKTLKGPQGRFQLNGDMAYQYFTSTALLHFMLRERNRLEKLLYKSKVHTSRSKIQI